jgi:hypothetical protein
MPERDITITDSDVPKIERALMAWFKSQGLNNLDANFVMAHLIGVLLLQAHKEGVMNAEESSMALSAIIANVAKGLHPMTGLADDARKNKRGEDV